MHLTQLRLDDTQSSKDGAFSERRIVIPIEMVFLAAVLEIRENDSWKTKVSLFWTLVHK